MFFEYDLRQDLRNKSAEISRLNSVVDALILQVNDLKSDLELERFWRRCDEEAIEEAKAAKMSNAKSKKKAKK